MIWLVGQYAGAPTEEVGAVIPGMYDWAPDVLRLVARSFADEVLRVILKKALQGLTLIYNAGRNGAASGCDTGR